MQQAEARPSIAYGGMQLDGHVDEAERDVALPPCLTSCGRIEP
jgi:hypothetical protein